MSGYERPIIKQYYLTVETDDLIIAIRPEWIDFQHVKGARGGYPTLNAAIDAMIKHLEGLRDE